MREAEKKMRTKICKEMISHIINIVFYICHFRSLNIVVEYLVQWLKLIPYSEQVYHVRWDFRFYYFMLCVVWLFIKIKHVYLRINGDDRDVLSCLTYGEVEMFYKTFIQAIPMVLVGQLAIDYLLFLLLSILPSGPQNWTMIWTRNSFWMESSMDSSFSQKILLSDL